MPLLSQIVCFFFQIHISRSPYSILALLMLKMDGTIRMCTHSRVINNITIKYRCTFLRLDDMLDDLHGAKVFSRIKLRCGYHQIRLRDRNGWKIGFKLSRGCMIDL